MTARRQGRQGAEHLVGDVQRFGLLSAATIVDRYIAIVDRATTGDGFRRTTEPAPGGDPDWLADTAATMARAYVTLVDTAATLVEDRSRPDAPGVERLLLPATTAGSCSETVLWIHNPTAEPAEVELHTTGLVSSSGALIPVDALALLPQPLGLVAPGSSQQVQLLIAVPSDQPAGQYHGLVLSSAASTHPVVVHLDVLAREVTES